MSLVCNLYGPPDRERIYACWRVTVPDVPYLEYVAPLKPGPFIVASGRALVGQWGLIPPGSCLPLDQFGSTNQFAGGDCQIALSPLQQVVLWRSERVGRSLVCRHGAIDA